ncbi:OmpH family outer membrane protein [Sphingomicrobium astaxanthinifaciens]|uniref:OmpH family outer membrane protein n=1 Tax=Sphingomicrobium astaxanthinifaciens TaxID=1227949 RepID=UPI001FCBF035|nr:OmpH family outer membrane protein [Sphingomicrobium astaxanthinifaciens]MCJ7420219.1 OmpH family outer membrane protein [Sphingomicrobium astaxanthinifaciens]
MKHLLAAAGLAAATVLPAAAASAQALPDAKIGVVDVNRVATTCTACATALQALEQQAQAVRAREAQLRQPLQATGQALQAEIEALGDAQPSADLQQRATAFQQQQQAAAQELQQRQAVVARNRNYILQQIGAAIEPAYQQVVARRGVHIILPVESTLAHQPAVDLTGDVLAEVNRTLTQVNVNAPAPQQPAAQTTPQQTR